MSPRVSISPLPPGAAFARFIKSLPHGVEFASAQFADTPAVAAAIGARRLQKAAAVPGMTTGNAPDLAALGIFDSATALLLAGDSAFEAARSRMRELLFAVQIPRQTDAGTTGGFIAEGLALPVLKPGLFDTLLLNPVLCGSIFVLTQDVLRRPGSEVIVRNAALGAQGRTESRLFLDPAIAATADSPASITHDATVVPWTGDATALLAAMLRAITTAGKGAAWILRPLDLAVLLAQLGNGAGDARSLLGLPVIPAPNAPAGQVTLADLAEIAYAASAVEVEQGQQATLEMESEPTNAVAAGSPEAPVATQLVSLFQTNSVGFKTTRFVNWSVVRDGAVAYSNIAGSPA
jgi:hypothetical protein